MYIELLIFVKLNYNTMKILNLLFTLIEPEYKITWLSKRFSRYKYKKINDFNNRYRKNNKDVVYFDVPGAGDISISQSCHNSTGKVVGFSFGTEWGIHGFTGGVIGRDEAKRMAEFILKKCNETSETMTEEYERKKTNY